MLGLTSFIWIVGIIAVVKYPGDASGYVLTALAAVTVGYLATERIRIADGRIIFSRFFIQMKEAAVADVELVPQRIGVVPFVRGFVVRRKKGHAAICQIVADNYDTADIQRLNDALLCPSLADLQERPVSL
jgi:hypothetical protein